VDDIAVMSALPRTWELPSWWSLEPSDDCFVLLRVDGIELSSFKTGMGFWGWCISKGGEQFTELYDEELVSDNEDGTEEAWPIVIEGAGFFPDPADFLFEIDQHYPVEA
jgi:hypothetical protein